MQKLGEGAKPFTLNFPQSAPNSVLIRGEEGDSAQMGVSYEVRLHIGESSDDFAGAKKNSVHMSIRKVNILLSRPATRLSKARLETLHRQFARGFTCCCVAEHRPTLLGADLNSELLRLLRLYL